LLTGGVRILPLLIADLPLLLDAGRILTLPAFILRLHLSRTDLSPIVLALSLLLNYLILSLLSRRLLALSFRSLSLLLTLLLRSPLLGRSVGTVLVLLGRTICPLLVPFGPASGLINRLILILTPFPVVPAALSCRTRNHHGPDRYYCKPPFNIPFHFETP